jgi:type II secretory pathway pseudopilin PulG
MKYNNSSMHKAISLLELLLVVTILGVVIGLSLGFVQKARQSATRAQSMNNLRQIGLGFLDLCNRKQDTVNKLPTNVSHIEFDPKDKSTSQQSSDMTVFFQILPFVSPQCRPAFDRVITYESPADISLNFNPVLANTPYKCSYAANMFTLDTRLVFPFSLPDGTSYTIGFSETYYYSIHEQKGECSMNWVTPFTQTSPKSFDSRRATFADKGWRDVVPVPDATGFSMASVPGVRPFEVRPPVNNSFCDRLQTPYAAGLLIAMFDGSVRMLSPSINEKIFWSLITPAGGEIIGDF